MSWLFEHFTDLRTKYKILITVGIPLAFLIILGTVSYISIGKMVFTSKWVSHTYEVLMKADGIIAAAVDMETGMRGYLLAGKEEFLDPYKDGEAAVYKNIAELQNTVSDNPKQVERLDEIRQVLKEWQSNVTQMQIQLRREVAQVKTMDHMAQMVSEDKYQKYFHHFREQIALFKEREKTLLTERQTRFHNSLRNGQATPKEIQDNMQWVNHTHHVLSMANSILAAAVDMETGMRGYLLAGKEEFLEPYNRGGKALFALTTQARQTVNDNPQQVQLMSEIENTATAWQKNVAQPMIQMRHEINKVMTMDNMADLVAQAKGKTYFDQFRGQIAQFKEREEILLKERDAKFRVALSSGTADQTTIENNLKWVNHTHHVLSKADDILAAAVDMETGMRGYLLAGKEEFLEPYNSGQAKLFDEIEEMKKTVSDNPSQVQLLGEIEKNMKAWQANITEKTIALRRNINQNKKMFHVASLVSEARGKQYFDHFRKLMKEFKAEEEHLIEKRSHSNAQTVAHAYNLIVICSVASILAGIGIALLISNGISKPLKKMTEHMSKLADGDTSIEIEEFDRKDEVGDMGNALVVLKENRIKAELLETQKKVRSEKIDQLVLEFDKKTSSSVQVVADAAMELQKSAQFMSQDVSNASENSLKIANSTSETSENVQSVAAAAEEMSVSVQEIARQMNMTNQSIQESAEKSETAGQSVKMLQKASDAIDSFSKKIGDIAKQINLLALNARIESSKAGEAGKGFSVVAGEVKNLANQAAQANNEISGDIGEIQSIVSNVVSSLEDINQSVHSVSESSGTIAESVEEQTAVTNEISSNMQRAASGVKNISDNISSIAEVSKQVYTSTENVKKAATMLSNESETLSKEIREFLTNIQSV